MWKLDCGHFFLKHGGYHGFDGNKSVKIYLILLFYTVNIFITMVIEYIIILFTVLTGSKPSLFSVISVKSAQYRDFLQEVELPG